MAYSNNPPANSRNPAVSFADPHSQYQRYNSSSSQDTTKGEYKSAPALPPKPNLNSQFSQASGLSDEPSLGYGSHQNLMGIANGQGNGGGPGHQSHRGGITGFLGMGQPGGMGGGAADSLSPSAAYQYGNQGQGQVASAAQQGGTDFKRKKSLVKPDRERVDPNHRLYHYREHAAALVQDAEAAQAQAQRGGGNNGRGANAGGIRGNGMAVLPSTTGNAPIPMNNNNNNINGAGGGGGAPQLRRGKSMLGREPTDNANESGVNFLKRGATLRRKNTATGTNGGGGTGGGKGPNAAGAGSGRTKGRRNENERAWGCWSCLGNFAPGPKDAWMVYCYLLTACVPGFVLRGVFGKRTPDAQRAWREKIGIVSINFLLMGAVGFITFGFTQTVCNNTGITIKGGQASSSSLVINGYDYDLGTWDHPAASPYFNGSTNPLYTDDWLAGGMDASFMFQTVNQHCKGILTAASGSAISSSDDGTEMAYYFPCNLRAQNLTVQNLTGYDSAVNCHNSDDARTTFYDLKATGVIYYTWEQIKNGSRNLAVFESTVLDLDLLSWLQSSEVSYPDLFDEIKGGNSTYQGKDITMLMYRSGLKQTGKCMADIIRVGFVDSKTIGCVASDVVLYVSLIFILGVVGLKFAMAVVFGWFLSWRLGNFEGESYKQRMTRAAEVEDWTDDIYRPAPSRYRPSVAPGGKNGGGANVSSKKNAFLPTTSRFSQASPMMVNNSRPSTAYGNIIGSDVGGGYRARQTSSTYGGGFPPKTTPPGSPQLRTSRSSVSLPLGSRDESRYSLADQAQSNCPFPLNNVIPQPPLDYEPFNFPLVQSICLVTAYSESIEGLRTTLDSLATTDYPNSHKVILVVADGMVKGSGSKLKTPDIVLGMMKDLVVPEQEVEAHSYVAIADGHKRHNMAKVYAGFYDYDNATIETAKQQKVPIVLVAKVGNPLEAHDSKPGNRGKRDSQIVLMAFLQKVMFDERMTTFEYEFFNSLWRVTGVSPDRYETVLCVDADTKVFPDSLTRMNACMVHDQEIMGLCGETKIANKKETWVTMIQVFEYYISHHSSKAFESVFGGVTCLPGCFSMYRIKAPKGDTGYWVPILANPDIVEHYSENVVDTLHKKNLYLLGEDRFLTTLMLKTFPKRKMIFVPQAVCKTVVPDTFRVLLSQRRRWINSTIHNLFELVLVRDLCGTFCFSMQFVVFMELVGTMVLPAAISFTLYIIIDTIIPGTTKPIISLILLAFILGLPGLLIVITSRKVAYVGWMMIYLLSLPVWNLILPLYAFWHMDDFSWGSTRVIEGEGKDKSHGDKDGLFDSSTIVMKRWVEFERERRWKSGTHSRDSYYDLAQRSSSPQRMTRDRYSVISTNETGYTSSNPSDTPFYRPSQSFASMDVTPPLLEPPHGGFRGARDSSPASSESADHSNTPNLSAYSPTSYRTDEERPMLDSAYPVQRPGYNNNSGAPSYGDGARTGTVPAQRYAQPLAAPGGYDLPSYPDEYSRTTGAQRDAVSPSVSRHKLTDSGPSAGAEPVRRVPRSASKRASFSSSGHNSQGGHTPRSGVASPPPQSQQSSSNLPPGAAPAQTGRYY